MGKTKKDKIPELYQILSEDGSPVRIKTGINCAIEKSRVGKIYQSKSAALSVIRKAMKSKASEAKSRFDYPTILKINKKNVTTEEWQEALLKLKIRIFQPASTEEVTFHLDKIN